MAAALLTEGGNVYLGVCIDTACSLGMCAERNAIANMITNSEHEINKLVCVAEGGRVAMPCGACRELMMQFCPAAVRKFWFPKRPGLPSPWGRSCLIGGEKKEGKDKIFQAVRLRSFAAVFYIF